MTKQKTRRILKRLVSLCLMMALVILPNSYAFAGDLSYADRLIQLAQEQNVDINSLTDVLSDDPEDIESGCVYRIRSVSDLTKYLTATSASSLALEAKDTSDNGQLWYISASGSYYTMENLGVRHTSSSGQYQYILAANSSTSVTLQTNQSTTSTLKKWEIEFDASGFHCIRNVGYTGSNRYVYNTGSNSVAMGTTLNNTAEWIFEKVEMPYYWNGRYFEVGYGTPLIVKIVVEDEDITSITPFSMYEAAECWNTLSPFVYVTVVHEDDAASTYGDVTVEVHYDVMNNRIQGEAGYGAVATTEPRDHRSDENWNENTQEVTTALSNGYWYKEIDIRLWGGINYSDQGEVQDGLIEMSTKERETVFIHEVGHVLKLKHPHESNTSYRPYAIMVQGKYSEQTCVPTGHDKASLIEKWKG